MRSYILHAETNGFQAHINSITMIIFKTVPLLEAFIAKQKALKKTIGFVPTMGALHAGHISLVAAAKNENELAVCSIFVNPAQFNNRLDFEKYPVTVEADIDVLENIGCDILFLPPVDEMYPPGTIFPLYELGYLETVLEGKYRPGHYQGVCRIVERLMRIVKPDALYLGQKDYQQCMVIKKMMELRDIKAVIRIEKTVREKDGLAMSSRNARLTSGERKIAANIFQALSLIKKELTHAEVEHIKQKANDFLSAKGFQVDYVEIAEAANLHAAGNRKGEIPLIALIAAYLNDVRLIDNIPL